jgi:hypothetical protein
LNGSDARFVDYYNRPWAKNWEKYFEKGLGQAGRGIARSIFLDIF